MDRTLEIDQKFAAISAGWGWGACSGVIQEKQPNLRKNGEFCGILTGLTSILFPILGIFTDWKPLKGQSWAS